MIVSYPFEKIRLQFAWQYSVTVTITTKIKKFRIDGVQVSNVKLFVPEASNMLVSYPFANIRLQFAWQ